MHTARAEAHSDYCLHHLSDPELLASTRGQVGRSNQILAALLAHLAEVEARGLHRSRACSSLYTYCIYELRMSEDAALRRVHAARILRRFPLLCEQIAAGELHLTAVLMLGPHLTEANHVEVLARAKHRTKREVAALVRQLDPLPDVPGRIEPLGPPAPSSPLSSPSAGKWAASLCGPVRDLLPGERPKDWGESPMREAFRLQSDAEQGAGGVLDEPRSSEPGECGLAERSHGRVANRGDTQSGSLGSCGSLGPSGSLGPQRYKVQFTASQEYVDLLEEARDLLAHAVPNRALEEVHLRALRLLVAKLKKRKYALTNKARSLAERRDKVSELSAGDPAGVRSESEGEADREIRSEAETGPRAKAAGTRPPAAVAIPAGSEAERELGREAARGPAANAVPVGSEAERERAPVAVVVRLESEREASEVPSGLYFTTVEIARGRTRNPRWRGRHVPAAVRRAVAERDCERCSYVDDDGERCRETGGLEFHHLEPHAHGGPPTVANLSLRCRAHNGLAAEQDFGREFMSRMKGTAP